MNGIGGFGLGRRFYWRKKLVAVAVVSTVLVGGLVAFWQGGDVVEAALLEPHPGLVGWWRFDEGTGTTATDSSGNGNDGTIYGATWIDGKFGKAMYFDGSNDYVEISADESFNFGKALTVSAWIKPDAILTTDFVVWRKTSPDNQYLCLRYANSRPDFDLHIDEAWHFCQSLYAVNTDWHFLVGTYDAEGDRTLRLYVDGNLVASSPLSGLSIYDFVDTFGKGRIGASFDGRYAKGIIDEVRIYNRALSEDEIQESFQNQPDFSSRLVAKIPKGTTQIIVTASWQGMRSLNVTIDSPSESYTEDDLDIYQKTAYSTNDGSYDMLNIKRLSIVIQALTSNENWNIILNLDEVEDYSITVECQK
jgi:hypothetical protein